MVRGNWVLRALLGAVLLVGVVWFFSVGVLAQRARETPRSVVVSNGKHEHWESIGRGKHHGYKDSDFHFVIKRRVPNGPDPIHNRRASLSRQPPGRT